MYRRTHASGRDTFDPKHEKRSRQAIDMMYRQKCTRKDLAKSLKLSESGAKSLLQRAKASLRECVERKMKNEEPID